VGVQCVLDRQRVKPEEVGDPVELGLVGLVETDPHEVAVAVAGVADRTEVVAADVEGDAHTGAVQRAVDDHAGQVTASRVTLMATVILARHGRTTANATGVLAGRTKGVRLDDRGLEQARDAGGRLAGLYLAAIVTSPLERAVRPRESAGCRTAPR
jgi:hypothetical protein